MTAIHPQFGTLHPNMQKAYIKARKVGHEVTPLTSFNAKSIHAFPHQLSALILDIQDNTSEQHKELIKTVLRMAPKGIAGLFMSLFANSDFFPNEVPQITQQIFYNRFIGEADLEKPTVNFDKEA